MMTPERKEYLRLWRAAHPTYNAKYNKKFIQNNPGYNTKYVQKFREENPTYNADYMKKWYAFRRESARLRAILV